jgi:hypothetical protein
MVVEELAAVDVEASVGLVPGEGEVDRWNTRANPAARTSTEAAIPTTVGFELRRPGSVVSVRTPTSGT